MKLFFSNLASSGNLAALSDYETAYIAKGVYIGSTDTAAISGDGTGSSVLVHGQIVSRHGIHLGYTGDDDGNYVRIYDGGSVDCPQILSYGVKMEGSNSLLDNFGSINAEYAVFIGSLEYLSTNTINNYGFITGNAYAPAVNRMYTSVDKIVLNNEGYITGYISYSAEGTNAVDVINNTGEIYGSVKFGGGADVYNGTKGKLYGDVYGGDGNDRFSGGKENNSFFGDAGADKLYGYLGADLLTGGSSADTFIYKSTSDSKKGNIDTIVDFSHAQRDLIDLHSIDANKITKGNQDFDFISSNAFSGHAGELHYRVSSGNTYVEADIDGNKTADMIIKLTGSIALSSGDFLL